MGLSINFMHVFLLVGLMALLYLFGDFKTLIRIIIILIISFLSLTLINLFGSKLNLNIPINLFSIGVVGFFGLSGVVMLAILNIVL